MALAHRESVTSAIEVAEKFFTVSVESYILVRNIRILRHYYIVKRTSILHFCIH